MSTNENPTPSLEIVEISNLPDDLADALHAKAKKNGNTIEQEVRSILETHLDESGAGLD